MKKIRTIVIDDEPLARARIIKLLGRFDDIQVIGEARNGREAIEMIDNYQPDLAFLDIQMPDLNGFDVLSHTPADRLPFIIFVTAFDQYALRAFDVHAVDYLLKPYDDERFAHALTHARQQISLRQNAHLHQKMVDLIHEFQQEQSEDVIQRLEVKDRGVTHHVNIDDIQVIEAHGNYIRLFLSNRSFLLRQTLQSLEEKIVPGFFLRIHRSLLINTHYIASHKYYGNNQFLFTMKNKQELLSSRGYREIIEAFLREEGGE